MIAPMSDGATPVSTERDVSDAGQPPPGPSSLTRSKQYRGLLVEAAAVPVSVERLPNAGP